MKLVMTFIIGLTFLICLVSTSCFTNRMETSNSIEIESIRQLFEKLQTQGVDFTKPYLYGYFFFDKERQGLERLSAELLTGGYTVVNLEQTDDGQFRLHVERMESHSPESLYQRGIELSEIATKYSVDTYDGFDVGNDDPSMALVSDESFSSFMNARSREELYALGEKLLDQEVYDRAEPVFIKCLEQKIRPQDSTHNLSFALLELNKTEEAVALLEDAVQEFPQHLKMRFNLAATHYELENFQKTIEHYQVAAGLAPNDASIMYGIAAAHFRLGQFDKALANCKKALALNPHHELANELLKQLDERR